MRSCKPTPLAPFKVAISMACSGGITLGFMRTSLYKQAAMRISCTMSTTPDDAWSEPKLTFTPMAISSGCLPAAM